MGYQMHKERVLLYRALETCLRLKPSLHPLEAHPEAQIQPQEKVGVQAPEALN